MARLIVAEEWKTQGVGAGEGPIYRGLGRSVPLKLVRASLKDLKAAFRERVRTLEEQERKHIDVKYRDTIWSKDAQELARGVRNQPGAGIVQAEMLRDVASTKTIDATLGPPATAQEIIEQLERTAAVRGAWPFVLATDNGGPYRSRQLEEHLARHQVIHLLNEPRTPEHNPWVEHGHGEHQEEMVLAAWKPPLVLDELADALERARWTLDHHRLRRTRGWKTADEYDGGLTPAEGVVSRAVFYEAACQAIARAVEGLESARERRRAEREAILATLHSFDLITRSRGGIPIPAPDAK